MYCILYNIHNEILKHFNKKLKPYRDSTNLVLADGDGVPIYSHIYLPDVRNCCVSPVIIPLSD